MNLHIPKDILLKSMRVHDGFIVALSVPTELANKLALVGDIPAEELHITVAYIENMSQIPLVTTLVSSLASEFDEFKVTTVDVGEFPDVVYLGVESYELYKFRTELLSKFDEHKVQYSRKFGWQPHITLSYENINPLPVELKGVSWVAEFIEIWNNGIRFRYPLANHQIK